MEGVQISGIRTCLLAENEGLKQVLSQKLCHFCLSQKLCSFSSRHSDLHSLVSERSQTRDGSPGGADTSPMAGMVPGCLEPETGSSPEAVWLLCERLTRQQERLHNRILLHMFIGRA